MKTEKEPLTLSEYKKSFKLIINEIDKRIKTYTLNTNAF